MNQIPMYNNNPMQQLLNAYGSINNLMNQYNNWNNNYNGNAEQEVRGMLNSGRLSQQQFNTVRQLAQMIQNNYSNGGYNL